MKKIILALFISTFAFQPSTAQWWQGSTKVEGNGKMATKTRTTSNYERVGLTGAMDVELVKGSEGRLRIEAEENLIPHILTEVKNGELVISVEKGFNLQPSGKNPVKITVPFESLDGVFLTGSGDIYTSDLIKSDNFETKITGSGNIRLHLQAKEARARLTGSGDMDLRGSAEDFNCKITGSGDINAFDFKCETVDATVIGSGNLQVHASEELRANVPGSGDIVYSGNPRKEDFKTLGSGSVSKQ